MKVVKNRPDDPAVAEIIGAILLFGIAITLVTSYLAWYVPTSQTSNDLAFVRSSTSDMSSLSEQIHSYSPGSQIVQSFDLGIAGTFPIIPAQDTQLSISNSSSFSYRISYNISVKVQNITGALHYYNFTVSSLETGYVVESAPLQYADENSLYGADGFMIQTYHGIPPSVSGPLPITLSRYGGNVNLTGQSVGFRSDGTSYSSTTTETLVLNSFSYVSTDIINGTLTSLNGSVSVVKDVKIENLNYTITTPYSNSVDIFLYRGMNGTLLNSAGILSLSAWYSSGGFLKVSMKHNSIYMTETSSVLYLNSIRFDSIGLAAVT